MFHISHDVCMITRADQLFFGYHRAICFSAVNQLSRAHQLQFNMLAALNFKFYAFIYIEKYLIKTEIRLYPSITLEYQDDDYRERFF